MAHNGLQLCQFTNVPSSSWFLESMYPSLPLNYPTMLFLHADLQDNAIFFGNTLFLCVLIMYVICIYYSNKLGKCTSN